jgi:hypothetical protein
MPIRYVETLKDLKNDEKEDLLLVLKRVYEVIRNVYKTPCVSTGIQTGEAAGQTVKVRKQKFCAYQERPKKGPVKSLMVVAIWVLIPQSDLLHNNMPLILH